MEYLGITGVKDLLQDNIIETFNYFNEAKLKTWILTGDKLETAAHICQSIGIVNRDRPLEKLTCKSFTEFKKYVEQKMRNSSIK